MLGSRSKSHDLKTPPIGKLLESPSSLSHLAATPILLVSTWNIGVAAFFLSFKFRWHS